MEAFLQFANECDRRDTHTLNESFIGSWQLRLLACSVHAIADVNREKGPDTFIPMAGAGPGVRRAAPLDPDEHEKLWRDATDEEKRSASKGGKPDRKWWQTRETYRDHGAKGKGADYEGRERFYSSDHTPKEGRERHYVDHSAKGKDYGVKAKGTSEYGGMKGKGKGKDLGKGKDNKDAGTTTGPGMQFQ
jgi:hypothetical protein